MTETVQNNDLWHVTLAEKDLVEQAELSASDFEQDFGYFRYRGRAVIMSHKYKEHLVVSMEGKEDEDLKQLMKGFSKVVNYEPFCKYDLIPEKANVPRLPTYEWDKINPGARFTELSNKPSVFSLVRLQ